MSNAAKRSRRPVGGVANRGRSPANRWVLLAAVLGIAAVAIGLLSNRPKRPQSGPSAPATPATSVRSGSSDPSVQSLNPAAPAELPRIEVKQAVMVTVELDFGAVIPSIADALLQIERRHQPEDGVGRVFAILDAYGGPTTDGRKLHMSMHVSTEKTGIGSLVYRRTGEVLWSNRIIPAADGSRSATSGGLVILLDDGSGRVSTVDGSTNPESIVQAGLKESGLPVEQFWPDGAEREVTFIYSACGCPVKVMCRREGNRTARTKDMPVMFPDDPAAVSVISRLMGW